MCWENFKAIYSLGDSHEMMSLGIRLLVDALKELLESGPAQARAVNEQLNDI